MAGCSDGTVRFYGPETGQLKRVLEGAHQTAVHAVAMSLDGKRLYSGDASGFFKVWQLGPQSHAMLAALKEHKVLSTADPVGNMELGMHTDTLSCCPIPHFWHCKAAVYCTLLDAHVDVQARVLLAY